MKYQYRTSGTRSQMIVIELDGDTVKSVQFVGGCPGNLAGSGRLSWRTLRRTS